MRGRLLPPLFSLCRVVWSPPRAEQTFPYTAYVTADDVFVRSGPGENYYATDKLKAGTPVEVYRHDPGGWYAIRPPKESFSWVSSRHLRLESSNLATVTDERVASRVGSRLSDVRDIIQVRLHKGETVEVLEPHGRELNNRELNNRELNGSPAPPWYKIAPPPGEFTFRLRPVRRSGLQRRTACDGHHRKAAARAPWQGNRDEPAGAAGEPLPTATRPDRPVSCRR